MSNQLVGRGTHQPTSEEGEVVTLNEQPVSGGGGTQPASKFGISGRTHPQWTAWLCTFLTSSKKSQTRYGTDRSKEKVINAMLSTIWKGERGKMMG